MAVTIRKALVESFGDYTHVKVVTAKIEPPAPDHVQVKVLYAAMGGADIQMRMGYYPMQKSAPLTPGYSLIGRVQQNGAKASKYKPGDLIACLTVYDAEAELVNLPEKYLIPVPEGIDIQQAAGLVLDWVTAYGMVYRSAKVQKGQRVFVHGLSGAVGYALFALSKLEGAEVYGTASEAKHAALRSEGAIPFAYKNKDWMMAMNAIGGAHVVFDALGHESWDESWSILAPKAQGGGILIGYGGNLDMLDGGKPRSQVPAIAKLLARNMVPFCPQKTAFFYISRDQKTYEPELMNLLAMCHQRQIKVPIKKVWDLEDIQEAHRTWSSMDGIGSVLVKVAKDGN